MTDTRYVALWLDQASQEKLKQAGVSKLPHLTIVFDASGILAQLPLEYTIPMYTPQDHRIMAIEHWVHNDKQFIVARLEDKPFTLMVQHLESQGVNNTLGFKAHITLWKSDIKDTEIPNFEHLIGETIAFDGFGFEGAPYPLLTSQTFELY